MSRFVRGIEENDVNSVGRWRAETEIQYFRHTKGACSVQDARSHILFDLNNGIGSLVLLREYFYMTSKQTGIYQLKISAYKIYN